MKPGEAKEFRNACEIIKKHMDDDDSRRKFEIVILRITNKALYELMGEQKV
jgi:hypothetical protein